MINFARLRMDSFALQTTITITEFTNYMLRNSLKKLLILEANFYALIGFKTEFMMVL